MAAGVQLIMLPGLGADRRMFAPQAAVFESLVVPPWIDPEPREPLRGYAARLARTITRPPGCPLVLGGVSLGGMIAYEMAPHLKPEALVLVATCRTRDGLACYRPLAPLARRVPGAAIALAQWLSPAAVRWFSGWSAEIQSLAIDMFRRADARFMRWALPALLDWEPSTPPNLPIFQIHGRHDRAIPADRVQADQVICDGGHLINLTHPAEVNSFTQHALKTVKIPTV